MTLTIIEGQHAPFTSRDEAPSQQHDTGAPMTGSWVSFYSEPDWYSHSADLGQSKSAFSLVYDAQSSLPTPEVSTWAMTLIGLAVLLILGIGRGKRLRDAKATSATVRFPVIISLLALMLSRVGRTANVLRWRSISHYSEFPPQTYDEDSDYV